MQELLSFTFSYVMFGGVIPLVNGNGLNVIVLHLQIISSKWQLVAVADCRAEI